MQLGTVKRLVSDRGFGFIKTTTGEEYFFHRSAVEGLSFEQLAEGERVQFEPVQGNKGPRAEHVRRN